MVMEMEARLDCGRRFGLVSTAGLVMLLLAAAPEAGFAQDFFPAPGTTSQQRLVPAGYGSRSDKKGNSWNFQQNGVLGRVGNSMLNTGLNLRVNNQNFYNYMPMMTADGAEYVLEHSHPQQMMGLQVTRRIRLIESEGVVRFIEVLANPGGHDITVNVELLSNFSGNYNTYISDEGNENFTAMNPKESSLLVMPASSSHTKAFVFAVCSPKSGLKPALTNQNKYSLAFHYNVTVPAGQTTCIMHSITQVSTPEKLDGKTLAKIFKTVALSRVLKTVPAEYRPLLANYSTGGGFGGIALLSSTSIEGLGVDRAKQDVLALGEKTRLLGQASCGELKVAATYGDVVIPFEDVAAMVGGNRGRSDMARIFLRDGQVFSGQVTARDLRFVMASGARMDLDIRSLDRLVRSETPDEGKWNPEVIALLETFHGERIALQGKEGPFLACVTPWGSRDFSLDEVMWISPPEEEPVGHHIEFKNGSRFFAYLGGEPPELRSRLFGDFRISPQEIRALITRALVEKKKEGEESPPEEMLQQPYLVMAGGQRLVGRITAPALNIITNAETLKTAPEAIRVMQNMSDEIEGGFEDTPPFQIELWGGGVVLGHVRETVIPVQVEGEEWRVPLQDIVAIVSPQPRISDAARAAIAKLIRDLGNDDWRTRESATEELQEYGYLAKSLLVDAIRVTNDAEVKRRLEQLIDAVE